MKSIVLHATLLLAMLSTAIADQGADRTAASAVEEDDQIADLSHVPVLRGRGERMREIVERLVESDFCGDAVLDGVTASAAANGEAPIEGVGFAKLDEEDFTAVAIEMAEEELAGLLAKHAAGEPVETRRLCQIAVLLGNTTVRHDEVLGVLKRIAERSLPEWGSTPAFGTSLAWIKLTIGNEGARKTVELGQFYQTARGTDSPDFLSFLEALPLDDAFGKCRTDDEAAVLLRFLVEASETCQSGRTARMIDKVAGGEAFYAPPYFDAADKKHYRTGAPGWKGSLQRRRLAERFDNDKLRARAAAELAADEKDLTDLREVYGEW